MATYIQGLTDFIPQVAPFKPDFNFYAGVLQQKQGQYNQNFEKVNNVYSSVLNATMLRDSNITNRDAYLKAADENIKKISGMDLSLDENVDAAQKVFEPFFNDKNIVNDIVKTRKFQNELSRAEGLRNCIDPKKCGEEKFWQEGVDALHYKMDEFRKASDDDALNFGDIRYTPYINIQEKASAAAKEAGLSITVQKDTGKWIVSDKNGALIEGPLFNHFMGLFQKDPKIQDMYKTQAYLQRKQWIQGNVEQGIPEAAAEQQYISHMQTEFHKFEEAKKANDKNHTLNEANKKLYEDKVKNKGVLKSNKERDLYLSLISQSAKTGEAKEYHSQIDLEIQAVKNSNNINSMRGGIDGIVSRSLFQNDIANAARTLAYKDAEHKIEANPYAKAQFESDLSLRNSMKMAEVNWQYTSKGKQLDHLLKQQAENGALTEFNPTIVTPEGGVDVKKEGSTWDDNMAEKAKYTSTSYASKENYLQKVFNHLKEQYTQNSNSPKAQEALRTAANNLLGVAGISAETLFSKDPSDVVDMIKHKQQTITDVYNKSLKVMDPHDPLFSANAEFDNGFWDKTRYERDDVKVRQQASQGMTRDFMNQSKKITAEVVNQYAGKDINGFRAEQIIPKIIDSYGNIKPQGQFIKDIERESGYKLTGEQVADLSDAYEDIHKEFKSTYQSKGQAWNGSFLAKGYGGSSAIKGGVQFDVTPNPQSQGHLFAVDAMQEVQRNLSNSGTKVYFGNPGNIPEATDPNAVTIFNQLYKEFTDKAKKGEQNNNKFKLTYQAIAGDDKHVAVKISGIDMSFKKKFQGTAKDPGITKNMGDEITAVVPKNSFNAKLKQATEITPYDYQLEHGHNIMLDGYGDYFNGTMYKKDDGKIVAKGQIKSYTPGKGETQTSFEKVFGETINAEQAVIYMNQAASSHVREYQMFEQSHIPTEGIRNPKSLLE